MTSCSDVTSLQLKALKDFDPTKDCEVTSLLDDVLFDVAKTGQYIFQWNVMKQLYIWKLDKVMSCFLDSNMPLNSSGDVDEESAESLNRERISLMEDLNKFTHAPFTLQRLTELILYPKQHYKDTFKFYRALKKNISVISTVEPVPAEQRVLLKRTHSQLSQNGFTESDLKSPVSKAVCTEPDTIDGRNNVPIAETSPDKNCVETTTAVDDGLKEGNLETTSEVIESTELSDVANISSIGETDTCEDNINSCEKSEELSTSMDAEDNTNEYSGSLSSKL